jgi:hypothetical protein
MFAGMQIPPLTWHDKLYFQFLEPTLTVAFIWLPLVFLAFAFGRRKVGLKFVFIFVTAESFAIWLAIYLAPYSFGIG